jgi:hypothetical protein
VINPSTIVDAVVSALQTNSALAAVMGNTPANIQAFHYDAGTQMQLTQAVYAMTIPGILVAWDGTQGGNFAGDTIWKHRIAIYIRADNTQGTNPQQSYEYIWYALVNGPVGGTGQNIRYINLLPDLDIMDTPSIGHRVDQNQIDYFSAALLIPEIFDFT